MSVLTPCRRFLTCKLFNIIFLFAETAASAVDPAEGQRLLYPTRGCVQIEDPHPLPAGRGNAAPRLVDSQEARTSVAAAAAAAVGAAVQM